MDEIFDEYVVREGSIQPLFTQFCNGTTSTCAGLSQWGTVPLAEQGLSPLEILKSFYGDDIRILTDTPVDSVGESYPGEPLRPGDDSNSVKVIQTELNRIAQNYPAIPKIRLENGFFGVDTEDAVRAFQRIFSLPVTGEVDKATWYTIKRYYNGVKQLSELTSEGINIGEATLPYAPELSAGMEGLPVKALQYYMDVIAYLNPELDPITVTGVFDPATVQAVENFQRFYGLPVTGRANAALWNILNREYRASVQSLPAGYENGLAKIYPGYILSVGSQGESVNDIQTYLSYIGRVYPEIPEIPVTGYYGTQTRDAVYTFQRLFGLPQSGLVGFNTWFGIANEYNTLKADEQD